MNRLIEARLRNLCDPTYKSFQQRLIPSVSPECIIGVRTPDLRRLAKTLVAEGECETLLNDLPHQLFEEDQLPAFILSEMKDFDKCITAVEHFLPYINNWATCDQLSPRCFARHKQELLPRIKQWMLSTHEYTIRFGIGMLMHHYLDSEFEPSHLEQVAAVHHEAYYVRMMQAWYFATALAKQYDATLPYIEKRRLAQWTHNKAIQKALESFRVTAAHKETLRALRWK